MPALVWQAFSLRLDSLHLPLRVPATAVPGAVQGALNCAFLCAFVRGARVGFCKFEPICALESIKLPCDADFAGCGAPARGIRTFAAWMVPIPGKHGAGGGSGAVARMWMWDRMIFRGEIGYRKLWQTPPFAFGRPDIGSRAGPRACPTI